MAARKRWRPQTVAAAVLATLGLATALVVVSVVIDDTDSGTSRCDPNATVDIAAPVDIDSYRIVYDTTTEEVTAVDRVTVDRPFRSVASTSSDVGDGRRTNYRISRFGAVLTGDLSSLTEIAVPPGAPVADLRLDLVLDDLEEAGQVERTCVREIAGERCQEYRAGGPIDGGTITPLGSDDEQSASFCVDRHGLVLGDRWVIDDEVVRVRNARSVDLQPDLSREPFDVTGTERLEAVDGGGAVFAVTADSTMGGRTFLLPTPPSGFREQGRFSIIRPRLGAIGSDPGADPGQDVIAGLSVVYVNGPDFVIVENGASRDGSAPFPFDRGADVIDFASIGPATVSADGRGADVVAIFDDGTYVRVFGSVSRAAVVELTERLELVTGGSLQFLGD